jgi:hypothetical protein
MTHNKYLSFAGQWSGAETLYGPTMRGLDQAIFEGVNGDDGGVWTPTSPIGVGGVGVRLTTAASVLTGDLVTLKNSAGIELADSDWINFVAARTRSVFVPFSWAMGGAAFRYDWDGHPCYPKRNGLRTGARSIEVAFDPLRMHNGATLSSIDLHLRVPVPWTGAPTGSATPCAVTVYRNSPGATPYQSLHSAGAVSDPVATGDAYYNSGKARVFTYTPNQNNVVDTSVYSYGLTILDNDDRDGGRNEYFGATLNFTNIAALSFE